MPIHMSCPTPSSQLGTQLGTFLVNHFLVRKNTCAFCSLTIEISGCFLLLSRSTKGCSIPVNRKSTPKNLGRHHAMISSCCSSMGHIPILVASCCFMVSIKNNLMTMPSTCCACKPLKLIGYPSLTSGSQVHHEWFRLFALIGQRLTDHYTTINCQLRQPLLNHH